MALLRTLRDFLPFFNEIKGADGSPLTAKPVPCADRRSAILRLVERLVPAPVESDEDHYSLRMRAQDYLEVCGSVISYACHPFKTAGLLVNYLRRK